MGELRDSESFKSLGLFPVQPKQGAVFLLKGLLLKARPVLGRKAQTHPARIRIRDLTRGFKQIHRPVFQHRMQQKHIAFPLGHRQRPRIPAHTHSLS